MNYPPADNIQPPDPEEVDRAVRDLFKDGDIKETSRHSRVPYGTLTKKLNPNDPTESVAYELLMFLYGCEMARPGLGDAVWATLGRLRPRRTQRASNPNGLAAAYHNLQATLAYFEDGECGPDEVQDAKDRLAEAVAGVGMVTHYPKGAHTNNLG